MTIKCFHCGSQDVYWITIDGTWRDRWECFDCGSYVDGHGGVAKSEKTCNVMIGGIIGN